MKKLLIGVVVLSFAGESFAILPLKDQNRSRFYREQATWGPGTQKSSASKQDNKDTAVVVPPRRKMPHALAICVPPIRPRKASALV
jgi:hypothetical protein